MTPTQDEVLGAVSLIFWTLTAIVLVKYVGIVMLADDDGEGGTFALYSLLCRKVGVRPHATLYRHEGRMMRRMSSRTQVTAISSGFVSATRSRPWWRACAASGPAVRRLVRRSRGAQLALWGLTMAATGMVLGDGVLTPAISVMSAVSGLKAATASVTTEMVVGVSIAILVLLYAIQPMGTGKISFIFAPVVALWLAANAGVGTYNLVTFGAGAFKGLSPHYIVLFFQRQGVQGWHMLGSVMLCVTGAEALYADLGHFSRNAILMGFLFFAYPCLVITYLGQASFLMARPEDVANTFWESVPRPFFYPMLVLATAASVVASQALISGAFSIVANAVRLGAFPKLVIHHMSDKVKGQIYIPLINWALMILCIAVVAGFKSTVALGLAYGLAVSAVLFITTLLVLVVMLAVWEVSLLLVVPFGVFFLVLEGGFLSANMVKVPNGGWFSLAVSAAVSYIMTIWWAGSCRRTALLNRSALVDLGELFVELGPGGGAADAAKGATSAKGGAGLGPAPASGSALLAKPSLAQRSSSSAGTGAVQLRGSSSIPGSKAGSTAATSREIVTASSGSSATQHQASIVALSAGPLTAIDSAVPHLRQTPNSLRLSLGPKLSRWRPVALALRLPDGEAWPLARQPGIGLYYSETPVGLPHVLIHFLRNVQSMHDVSIFVTVRIMSMPHVQPSERIVARCLPDIPNFYQALVRYGYRDTVEHGAAFVTRLVDAVVGALRREGGRDADAEELLRSPERNGSTPDADEDEEGEGQAADVEGGAGVGPALAHASAPLPTSVYPAVAVPHRSSDTGAPAKPAKGPKPSSKVDVSKGPAAAQAQAQGQAQAQAQGGPRPAGEGDQGAALVPQPAGGSLTNDSAPRLDQQLTRHGGGAVDEGAVAHVMEALQQGVVYYLGSVRVRADPSSGALNQLLFGSLYRGLLSLSHSLVEDWSLPYEQVVELGMVLRL
ncbi:hypothetical protein HYH03_004865 [Edaphochlamys debaryana]|uniref:Potassium transporter n=1 Tax=Edaphochlamys debaryana TaxID=47281 RepID=A0A835Y746_9CHLO|nr:hypothetical protein HYH03_004865 [Edaphochlamys debaryana]|eukprot:KAG2497281.1 hypothetical protein HYH03_004865 [Edaphochlamys debaryana]